MRTKQKICINSSENENINLFESEDSYRFQVEPFQVELWEDVLTLRYWEHLQDYYDILWNTIVDKAENVILETRIHVNHLSTDSQRISEATNSDKEEIAFESMLQIDEQESLFVIVMHRATLQLLVFGLCHQEWAEKELSILKSVVTTATDWDSVPLLEVYNYVLQFEVLMNSADAEKAVTESCNHTADFSDSETLVGVNDSASESQPMEAFVSSTDPVIVNITATVMKLEEDLSMLGKHYYEDKKRMNSKFQDLIESVVSPIVQENRVLIETFNNLKVELEDQRNLILSIQNGSPKKCKDSSNLAITNCCYELNFDISLEDSSKKLDNLGNRNRSILEKSKDVTLQLRSLSQMLQDGRRQLEAIHAQKQVSGSNNNGQQMVTLGKQPTFTIDPSMYPSTNLLKTGRLQNGFARSFKENKEIILSMKRLISEKREQIVVTTGQCITTNTIPKIAFNQMAQLQKFANASTTNTNLLITCVDKQALKNTFVNATSSNLVEHCKQPRMALTNELTEKPALPTIDLPKFDDCIDMNNFNSFSSTTSSEFDITAPTIKKCNLDIDFVHSIFDTTQQGVCEKPAPTRSRKLLVFMDSNREYIKFNEMFPSKKVNVLPCANLDVLHGFLRGKNFITPDEILIHVGTNDLQHNTTKHVALKLLKLTIAYEREYNCIVYVSTLTPRKDKYRYDVQEVNDILKSIYEDNVVNKYIFIITHDNINTDNMLYDNKHLKRDRHYLGIPSGLEIFCCNLYVNICIAKPTQEQLFRIIGVNR